MEAKELRIGNYFYDRSNKILRLDWWEHINKLASDMSVNGIKVHPMTEHIGNARPIPLTEEWLVKLNPNKLLLSKDKFGILIWIHGDKLYIEHVHQLQNLYFALTNEELTIKN